jgi:hypothetical protein
VGGGEQPALVDIRGLSNETEIQYGFILNLKRVCVLGLKLLDPVKVFATEQDCTAVSSIPDSVQHTKQY